MSQIFIIYCISVTTMSHKWKSAAQMLQNFHHILYISDYNVSPMEIFCTNIADFSLYTPFGDGEGWGYTVRPSFNVCQSHQQKSAARMPNLWHKCRRFLIIDRCLSVTPPGICGTFATEYFSICQLFDILLTLQ
jgi:hypothetical protein